MGPPCEIPKVRSQTREAFYPRCHSGSRVGQHPESAQRLFRSPLQQSRSCSEHSTIRHRNVTGAVIRVSSPYRFSKVTPCRDAVRGCRPRVATTTCSQSTRTGTVGSEGGVADYVPAHRAVPVGPSEFLAARSSPKPLGNSESRERLCVRLQPSEVIEPGKALRGFPRGVERDGVERPGIRRTRRHAHEPELDFRLQGRIALISRSSPSLWSGLARWVATMGESRRESSESALRRNAMAVAAVLSAPGKTG